MDLQSKDGNHLENTENNKSSKTINTDLSKKLDINNVNIKENEQNKSRVCDIDMILGSIDSDMENEFESDLEDEEKESIAPDQKVDVEVLKEIDENLNLLEPEKADKSKLEDEKKDDCCINDDEKEIEESEKDQEADLSIESKEVLDFTNPLSDTEISFVNDGKDLNADLNLNASRNIEIMDTDSLSDTNKNFEIDKKGNDGIDLNNSMQETPEEEKADISEENTILDNESDVHENLRKVDISNEEINMPVNVDVDVGIKDEVVNLNENLEEKTPHLNTIDSEMINADIDFTLDQNIEIDLKQEGSEEECIDEPEVAFGISVEKKDMDLDNTFNDSEEMNDESKSFEPPHIENYEEFYKYDKVPLSIKRDSLGDSKNIISDIENEIKDSENIDPEEVDEKDASEIDLQNLYKSRGSRKSIGIIEVNLDKVKETTEIPDINIHVDMNEVDKKATVTINMPESWKLKVFKKRGRRRDVNTTRSTSTESDRNEGQDESENADVQTKRPKEQLDIDISMFLDEFDLEDSTLYASINSKKDSDANADEKDTNSDEKKSDFGFAFPNIEFPFFGETSTDSEDDDSETPPQRYDFRYQLPKIEFPFFSNSSNEESDLSKDSLVPDEQREPEVLSKRYDFRYQLPKIEFPFFNDNPRAENELQKDELDDADVSEEEEITPKRFDFRYQLPKIDLPFFFDNPKVGDDLPKNEVVLDADLEAETPPKRYDFRFQLPKIEFPFFTDTPEAEGDLTKEKVISDADMESKIPPKRYDFRYQLPKIEFPFFDDNIETEKELKKDDLGDTKDGANDPDEDENLPKRFDFRYQLPKIEFPYFNTVNDDAKKVIEVEPDHSESDVSVDIKGNISENESNDRKHDFRFQLPAIGLSPSQNDLKSPEEYFTANPKKPDPDINIQGRLPERHLTVDVPVTKPKPKVQVSPHQDVHIDIKITQPYVPEKSDLKHTKAEVDFENRTKKPMVELPTVKPIKPKVELPTIAPKPKVQLPTIAPKPRVDLPTIAPKPKVEIQITEAEPRVEICLSEIKPQSPTIDSHFDIDLSKSENNSKINSKQNEHDLNIESPEKRYDFRYQLPKIEFPSFGADVEDSKVPNEEVKNDVPIKRYDFRFQLPTFEFPFFGEKSKSPNNENHFDIDVEKPEHDVNDSSKNTDFKFQFPTIDLFSFSNKPKSPTTENLDAEDTKSSEIVEDTPKRYDFRYQLPRIEFPLFGFFEKCSADDENDRNKTDISIDVNAKFVENDANGETTVKRHEFRFRLPSIELPSFGYKPIIHNAVADIDIDHNKSDINADIDFISDISSNPTSPTKRYDFRFQLPTLEFPDLSDKKKSFSSDKEHELIDDKNEIKTDIDEGKKSIDLKDMLPSFEFFSFGNKTKSPITNVGLDDGAPVDTNADDNMSDEKDHAKTYDFRFQLPKMEFPSIVNKDDSEIQKSNDAFNDIDCDLYLSSDTLRYNFIFSFPEDKFRNHDGFVKFMECEEDDNTNNNGLSLLFDGGDSNENNMFKIKLKNNFLTCSECFEGVWQPEITCKVMCVAPQRNVLVTLLSTGDSKVVILFNHEVMFKYNLKGPITTLSSFQGNGAVKLNSAKLCNH